VASNSQDLNPVDYAVSGALQRMVYQRRRFTTINQLKLAIVIECGKLSQRFTHPLVMKAVCTIDTSLNFIRFRSGPARRAN